MIITGYSESSHGGKRPIAIVFLAALLVGLWLPTRIIVSTSASLEHRVFFMTTPNIKRIKNGDYLVFNHDDTTFVHPGLHRHDQRYIKKVGCSPGQTLKRDDSNHFLCGQTVIGEALEQDSRGRDLPQFSFSGEVPDNNYFMVGAHRGALTLNILDLSMQTRLSIRHCPSGKHLRWIVLLLALGFLSAFRAAAEETTFYQESKHGWFWYEDPPPEQEKDLPAEQTIGESHPPPSLDSYTIDDLWTMHPDDFQNLLNVLQKKAVQAPTEPNILEYLTMQDIARRKALAYTNATMYVTQKYGELFNVNHVYPTAGPGVTARVSRQNDEIFQTINRAGADHACFFSSVPDAAFVKNRRGFWAISSINMAGRSRPLISAGIKPVVLASTSPLPRPCFLLKRERIVT